MSLTTPQREQMLIQLKHIILDSLKDQPVKVYLFGSWARNEEKRSSDIDIAFRSTEQIPMRQWVELREQIEESTIPYKVDLVDLTNANDVIIKKVKKEGIIWKDYPNECKPPEKH